MWSQMIIPSTIEEAVNFLSEMKGKAVVMGGGTDLVPQYRTEQIATPYIVDVTRIDALNEIRVKEGYIHIGGSATHAQVVQLKNMPAP